MRQHVCWGNTEAPHVTDVPLIEIIGELLKARPAGLVIEGRQPRHAHEWSIFEDVPLPTARFSCPASSTRRRTSSKLRALAEGARIASDRRQGET
jgi:hypothetical protein